MIFIKYSISIHILEATISDSISAFGWRQIKRQN